MKLLHTSDWHLGAVDGDYSLREDQRFFIEEIIRVVQDEQADAVMIAGDVYDNSISSGDAIQLYDYAMSELVCRLGIPVICIAGNHDSAERLSSCRELLKNAGLHVCGALEREVQKVSIGNADIYLLPWFTEQKVRSLYPEKKNEVHSLQDAYQTVCDRIRENFVPGRRHIALSHAYIVSAETSTSDRAAEIGNAAAITADVFDGFDYVALGHIHKPQDIGETIRYSGTPMPFSFGKEEKQIKSVTLIDTETMERKTIPLRLRHKRTTIEGTYDEIISGDYPEEIQKGYVRILVTDQFIDSIKLAALAGKFPNYRALSGKHYEDENGGIHMTAEEFEEMQDDPEKIFARFCTDITGSEPDGHMLELFVHAMEAYNENKEEEK